MTLAHTWRTLAARRERVAGPAIEGRTKNLTLRPGGDQGS
jgi:hypothetical protein